MNLKTLLVVCRPSYIRETLKNIRIAIDKNLGDVRLKPVVEEFLKYHSVHRLIQVCFKWVYYELLLTVVEYIKNGELFNAEEECSGITEIDPNYKSIFED